MPVHEAPVHPPLDEIAFAHASERVAAEILDFYRIRWQYEPRTFPLEWDGQGRVISSFSPDFYLVDFDLYIELTTMSQKLVTKKNRKVRRLKELYPEVNVKIFYQKDFRRLLARFGVPSVVGRTRSGRRRRGFRGRARSSGLKAPGFCRQDHARLCGYPHASR